MINIVTKKKNSFLKEKIILKLIFTTYYNKKLVELRQTLLDHEKEQAEVKKIYLDRLRKTHDEKKRVFKNNFLLGIKRFLGMKKEKALIFNDNGDLETIINILPTENEFNFKDNKYLVDRDKITSKIKLSRILEVETYYFYNINVPTPLTLGTPLNALAVDPKELGAIMDSKQLINLNRATSSLSGLLEGNMKWVLLGIAGVILYYVFGGG